MTRVHSEVPSTRRLLKATALALAIAGVLLVTTVLPAEYGIDPTGVGAKLGLDVLAAPADAAEAPAAPQAAATPTAAPSGTLDLEAAERAKSAEVFGASTDQSFDLTAVSRRNATTFRTETMTVQLPPGKGAGEMAVMKAGDGIVFHWTASGEVALDMHGERPDSKHEYTSYWIEGAQRQGAGTFTAPFDGNHGWYWRNRSNAPITVTVEDRTSVV